MEFDTPAPIIVAVDDAGLAEDAVDWAAAEAAAAGSPLRLVHALVPTLALDPYSAGAMLEWADVARSEAERLLHNAVSRATSVAPEIKVSTRVLDGTVTWALRREAQSARLLVVGSHRPHAGLRGLLTPSISGELAGHAPCPVIVLHHLDAPVAGAARVVVGVNPGRSCSAAIGFAFRAARQRGIPLTLVHVCGPGSVPAALDTIVDPATFVAALGDRAVAQSLSRWHDEFLDVPVVAKLLTGEPAQVLIAESAGAAMLVVGSRGLRRRLGRLLGSISQGVVENAGCPIAIIRRENAPTGPSQDARRAEVHGVPR